MKPILYDEQHRYPNFKKGQVKQHNAEQIKPTSELAYINAAQQRRAQRLNAFNQQRDKLNRRKINVMSNEPDYQNLIRIQTEFNAQMRQLQRKHNIEEQKQENQLKMKLQRYEKERKQLQKQRQLLIDKQAIQFQNRRKEYQQLIQKNRANFKEKQAQWNMMIKDRDELLKNMQDQRRIQKMTFQNQSRQQSNQIRNLQNSNKFPTLRQKLQKIRVFQSSPIEVGTQINPIEVDQMMPQQPKQRIVQRIVQRPVQKIIQRPVQKIVYRPIQKVVQKIVQKPIQKVVQKIVQKPVLVQKIVERIVQKPVEKIVKQYIPIIKPEGKIDTQTMNLKVQPKQRKVEQMGMNTSAIESQEKHLQRQNQMRQGQSQMRWEQMRQGQPQMRWEQMRQGQPQDEPMPQQLSMQYITINQDKKRPDYIYIGQQISNQQNSYFTHKFIHLKRVHLRKLINVIKQMFNVRNANWRLRHTDVMIIKDRYKGILYYGLRHCKWYYGVPQATRIGFNLRQYQMRNLLGQMQIYDQSNN